MTGNPFTPDIFPDGHAIVTGSCQLHGKALSDLIALVEAAGRRSQSINAEDGGGMAILLKSLRAGFGKSHLMARLAGILGEKATVIPLEFDAAREVQWTALLWNVLERCHHESPNGVSLLDNVARRTFSFVNQQLIIRKLVPCANPAEALEGLEKRYLELFDFSNPQQPVARWFTEHFERLLPVAAPCISTASGLTEANASHWLRVLCAYAQGSSEGETTRWEGLRWGVMQSSGAAVNQGGMSIVSAGPSGEAGARQRLVEFLRLLARVRPVLFVCDHLDLFHRQMDQIQRIAGVMSEIRRLVARAVTVLSVNQDLWTQTFLKSLPSALEDRLTGQQLTLGGIGRTEAESILGARLAEAGIVGASAQAFWHHLNLTSYFSTESGRMVSPRALLRYAAEAWTNFTHSADAARFGGVSAAPPPLPNQETTHESGSNSFLEVPETASADQVTPVASGDPSFQKLRSMLDKLRAAQTGTPGEPATSGVILADPVSSRSLPNGPQVLLPPAAVATTEQLLEARFHRLRTHFQTAPWLNVDQERLFHLLKVAGQRLAVVRWVDLPLHAEHGYQAGAWQGPDGEIVFGSEPYEDRTYWTHLIDFVRQRSGHGFGPPGAQGVSAPGTRLVVFSSRQAPVNLTAWMPQDEIIYARTYFLDIQPADQHILSTLYAADEMMREAERETLGATSAQAFSALAPHIDFLWKKVTRPVKS